MKDKTGDFIWRPAAQTGRRYWPRQRRFLNAEILPPGVRALAWENLCLCTQLSTCENSVHGRRLISLLGSSQDSPQESSRH